LLRVECTKIESEEPLNGPLRVPTPPDRGLALSVSPEIAQSRSPTHHHVQTREDELNTICDIALTLPRGQGVASWPFRRHGGISRSAGLMQAHIAIMRVCFRQRLPKAFDQYHNANCRLYLVQLPIPPRLTFGTTQSRSVRPVAVEFLNAGFCA
jgi:hypothetical protein